MKTLPKLFLFPAVLATTPLCALTPAEQKINQAEARIEKTPEHFQAYNALALAYTLRARETHDPSYYDQADEMLSVSFKLSPDNHEAQKVKLWTLLGKHDFQTALAEASQLNEQIPDDLMTYAILADSCIELGLYDKAEAYIQWMLDLQPGNIPGLTRASYFRELTGDIDGALDLFNQAYQQTPSYETEQRAWLLTQSATLHKTRGDVEVAEELLLEALETFTDYHYALAAMAEVKQLAGDLNASLQFYEQLYQVAPHPENMYQVGLAQQRLGNEQAATEAFKSFEMDARKEMLGTDNANIDLIYYYTDQVNEPGTALKVARLEMKRRGNAFTQEAYAWALHHAGEHKEALKTIEPVVALGVQDARVYYHAGSILLANGNAESAKEFFHQAQNLNKLSPWAEAAKQALEKIDNESSET